MKKYLTLGLLAATVMFAVLLPVAHAETRDAPQELERLYAAWKDATHVTPWDSQAAARSEEVFDRIVALGIPAVPAIIERMERGDTDLARALERITKKCEEPPPGGSIVGGSPDATRFYLYWWHEGRSETARRFNSWYNEGQQLKEQGRISEARKRYTHIVGLGLDALPLIVEKVKAGDADLLPMFNTLTDNALGKQPTIASAVAWWEANKDKCTLPPSDSLPAASQPPTKPARHDLDRMLADAKAGWSRKDYSTAERLAQEVLKHPQATDEQKRQAQLILDRVAELRSGAGTSQPATSATNSPPQKSP
jgi:hypothetical protein